MSVDPPPLLLTASISPGMVPFVALTDPRERALQYFCAVLSWLRQSPIRDVVLAENTGSEVSFDVLQDVASALGKRLEVLCFDGNDGARRFGKGHGEGGILEHALARSALLSGRPAFCKCTGRLFLANFAELAPLLDARDNTFFEDRGRLATPWQGRMTRLLGRLEPSWGDGAADGPRQRMRRALHALLDAPLWVDTRFFRVEVDFFQRELSRAWRRCDDVAGYYLEHAYHDVLRRFPEALVWKVPTRWIGASGTLGAIRSGEQDYDPGLRQEAEALLVLGNPSLAARSPRPPFAVAAAHGER